MLKSFDDFVAALSQRAAESRTSESLCLDSSSSSFSLKPLARNLRSRSQ